MLIWLSSLRIFNLIVGSSIEVLYVMKETDFDDLQLGQTTTQSVADRVNENKFCYDWMCILLKSNLCVQMCYDRMC